MSRQRRTWTPQEKANIVLEILREESPLAEISKKYDIAQPVLSRWKTEFISNMPAVFDKKGEDVQKVKEEYEEEKEILIKKIGELSMDVDYLKKKQEQVLQLRKKRH
ncbi:transposase [Petrocella atlantisensis]|uniref:Transposase n=1 Tax=Petrocella atlantisensis TaxID=2173034 RepID=A0A3P7S1C6_9FIRM|nr:transposase [Petrocella atlantisensis]